MRLIIVLGLMLCVQAARAQQEIFNGIVVDSSSFAPLPWVNVQVKGTFRGTTTDVDGKFGVMATRADTIILSLLGYQSLELPLTNWEASVVRMAERPTILNTVTIQGESINLYEGMFADEHEKWKQLNKKLPFYYSRRRKDKALLARSQQENLRVKTYVEVVIKNPETRTLLMSKYSLSEQRYYEILTRFNEKYHTIMYYLTAPELLTLLNNFFQNAAP